MNLLLKQPFAKATGNGCKITMKSTQLIKYAGSLLLISILLSGCGHKHGHHTVLSHRSQTDVLQYLDNYHPAVRTDGQQINFEAFINDLANKQVVHVGERHDRYDHHLNQLAVLKALYKNNPDMAIGVEWFQEPYQAVVDDYIAGNISEKELLVNSEYYSRWGYDYRMMRPILEFARSHKIPVLALNADATVTRKVGKEGLASLTDEQRATLPETITLPPEDELESLKKIFAMHPEQEGRSFDNFVTVQRIWDIGMAENLANHLEQHPKRKIIVFAGSGHLKKNAAIPRELKKQKPDVSSTVVHSALESLDQSDKADYVILSLAKSLPPIGKMGIWLDDADNGVLVKSVMKETAAAAAGVLDGDIITHLNNQPMADSAALKMALSSFIPGDKVSISVLRKPETGTEESKNIELTLR